MTDAGLATPAPPEPPGIDAIDLPVEQTPLELAERLLALPERVDVLRRRQVTTAADSATAVFIDREDVAQPKFGMVVALVVQPVEDADAVVERIRTERWGPLDAQTVTFSTPGGDGRPAEAVFWRAFAPGLFAIPNQPVYFHLWYRAGAGQAFMVIAATPVLRDALVRATATALTPPPG